jgi:hypothetical protein
MVHTVVHSRGQVLVEDQPISGRRVFLYLSKRKIRCSDGRIRVEDLPWLRGRFTRRFAEQVFRLTSIVTNDEAGWFLGLDDKVVHHQNVGDTPLVKAMYHGAANQSGPPGDNDHGLLFCSLMFSG